MLSAARTVIGFGALMQVAGFAKVLMIAAYFGAGPQLDAYYLGLVIPTFIVGVSGGILQTGFMPAYIEAGARGDGVLATQLRNAALTWTLTVLGALALLVTAVPYLALLLVGTGVQSDVNESLRACIVVLMWTAPLNGLADAAALILNAERRFAAAAAAPFANLIVSMLILVLFGGDGIGALVWGLILGLLVQIIIVWVALGRMGIRYRLAWNVSGRLPDSIVSVVAPVFIASVLANLIPAFLQLMSARVGPGAVSAMGYASRLHTSIVQTVVMSVSAVLLPHFARLLADKNHVALRATLERVFAATLLFFLATLSFVAASGSSTVSFLLERGRFTHADAQIVSDIWLAFTLGLLGTTWGIYLARLFQALRQPWVLVRLSFLSLLINMGLSFALVPLWGVLGIVLANSIAYALITVLLHWRAAGVLGQFVSGSAVRFIALAVGANLAAFLAASAFRRYFGNLPLSVVIAVQVLIVAAANLAICGRSPLRISFRSLLAGG